MKKIMELMFYNKNIYCSNGLGYKMVKSNLCYGTPTVFLAKADEKNKQLRRYYKYGGIDNCYCRVCDNLFIAPNAVDRLQCNKKITCPICGHIHNIENVRFSYKSSTPLPLYVTARLYEKNNSIRLMFSYEAVILGENVFNDFTEHNRVTEFFDFNYTEKQVVWTKTVNAITEEVRELGYLDDILNPIESVMKYIPYSEKDRTGIKMSALIAKLRNVLQKVMSRIGYSKRKMFLHLPKPFMVERNILYMARKIRFWDENEDFRTYQLLESNLRQHINFWNIPNLAIKEKRLSELLQGGATYTNAFITIFNLYNLPIVRKNIGYSNLYPLSEAHQFNDRNLTTALIPYFLNDRPFIKDIVKYYNTLAKYYPQKSIKELCESDKNTLIDTNHLYARLNKKSLAIFENNIPHFKDLHDYLSKLVTAQEECEINYNIPEHIINRLNMQLQNSNCKVLTKYSQIRQAGIDLKNCAASYRHRINDKLQLVLITDANGKAKVLLEVKDNTIIQAKLWSNARVKMDETYNKLVLDFANKANLQISTNDIQQTSNDILNIKSA